MDVLTAIACGIGLAEKHAGCDLCDDPRRPGACPNHAAPNVARILREFGYLK